MEVQDGFIAGIYNHCDSFERIFPNARAFVRPAFEEPEEVAKLRAAESE